MAPRPVDWSSWRQGAGASYLGLFFVVAVSVCALGGIWLDNRFHKSPLFSILGVTLGFIAGIRECVKALRASNQAQPPGQPARHYNPPEPDRVADSNVRDAAGGQDED